MARDRVGDGVERTGEAEITAVYLKKKKKRLLLTVPQVEPRHENMCGASGGNYRFHKAGGKGMGSGDGKKKKTVLKALNNGSRCVCTVTISSVFSYGRSL